MGSPAADEMTRLQSGWMLLRLKFHRKSCALRESAGLQRPTLLADAQCHASPRLQVDQWLLPAEAGGLEAEGMERTWRYQQVRVKQSRDEASSRRWEPGGRRTSSCRAARPLPPTSRRCRRQGCCRRPSRRRLRRLSSREFRRLDFSPLRNPRSAPSQEDIVNAVDATAARKAFDLTLPDLGPYCLVRTRRPAPPPLTSPSPQPPSTPSPTTPPPRPNPLPHNPPPRPPGLLRQRPPPHPRRPPRPPRPPRLGPPPPRHRAAGPGGDPRRLLPPQHQLLRRGPGEVRAGGPRRAAGRGGPPARLLVCHAHGSSVERLIQAPLGFSPASLSPARLPPSLPTTRPPLGTCTSTTSAASRCTASRSTPSPAPSPSSATSSSSAPSASRGCSTTRRVTHPAPPAPRPSSPARSPARGERGFVAAGAGAG